ncbi:hypothetical protein [Aeromonas phage ZPAH34]|uniref:hypothetical protein n=1 Tax=Aeromonas phage ZPAH34 TaxID=2924888 RepID=UPI002329043A|nr:hypothetical protein PQD16_gp008 [Aeromonas phage ZPAH34]UOX39675.1 hypothetical protein [Aeromonas phage ZPAH34]
MKITLKEVKQAIDTCMFSVLRFLDKKTDRALIVFDNKEIVGRGINLIRENGTAIIKITNMDVMKAQKVIEEEINEDIINAPFAVRCDIYKKLLIKEIATLIFENNFDLIFDCEEIRKEVEREFEWHSLDTILMRCEKEQLDKLSTVLWKVYTTSEIGETLEVGF